MKKMISALLLTFVAISMPAAEVVEAIVARVGDRVITRTQYMRRMKDGLAELDQTTTADKAAKKAEFTKNLINDLLSELLIKDRADRLGITVTDGEVKQAVGRLKEQYGISTDAQFDESLQKSGMSRIDMESRLRETLISNKVFAKELRPREDLTDRELREKYDKEKDHYRLPERAHLREIIVLKDTNAPDDRGRKKAADVVEQARSGADFVKLAGQFSEAPTKDKGGDLGEVARGELLPELDKAVFNSAAGAIVGPIETKSGFHILKVEQRLPSEVPAFESVKDKLRKDVSDESFQRDYKSYIERLRKEAFIQINENNVPSV